MSLKLKVEISFDSYLELENISNGSFYPLSGFMNKEDFISVCKTMRLTNGKIFPIPIILPISDKDKEKIELGRKLYLTYNKKIIGSLIPNSIFYLKFKNYIKLHLNK